MSDISVEAFSEEVEAFLEANARPRAGEEEKFVWGEGEDAVAVFEEKDRSLEQEELAGAQEWRAKRFDAGLGWITGPEEYGGRGLTQAHERAYAALESRYAVPPQTFFGIGLGMVAPTILAHGSDVTKDAYLRKLYRGEIVACQLFSEPAAGSDLASLTSRAERDGDEWVVSGQKVWTSGAHYSDIGEIIVRTDFDQPKHRGLTGFVVNMRDPRVEIRPLRQMTGGASFNEVFFDEVRVPDDHRLGEVNQGWGVALTTLMNERASIGAGPTSGAGGSFTRLVEMVRHFGLSGDDVTREELMRLYAKMQVSRYTNQRAMDKIKSGQAPGPELSIAKMALTDVMVTTSAFVSSVLGPRMVADTGEWGTFSWSRYVCGMPGMRVAGGTDEVLRNIVGERVLGLPKEPGIDTTSAFKELRTN